MRQRFFAILLLAGSLPASAATLDGKQALVCSASTTIECLLDMDCSRISNESIDAPALFRIDFDKKTVSSMMVGHKARPPAHFDSFNILEGKLFIQGHSDSIQDVRDALAWSLSISQYSAKMVLSAAAEEAAYVIFGSCSPLSTSTGN